jgi:5'-methylthioadenosine phosphorylase
VELSEVLRIMGANVERAQALVTAVAGATTGGTGCPQGCDHAMEHAVMTAKDYWPDETRRRLATLLPKLFG